MTPDELVVRFADLALDCLAALRHEYAGFDRLSVRLPMTVQPRSGGESVRSGELIGLGRFRIHGGGCRFELTGGEEVDVDWDNDGTVVFDSWRILMFAKSMGNSSMGRDSLRMAASGCPSLKPVRDDWFTLANRGFDVVRGNG